MHIEYVLMIPDYSNQILNCFLSEIRHPTGWAHIYDMPVLYYHPDVPYNMKLGDPKYIEAYGLFFTKWLTQSDLVDTEYSANNAKNYGLFYMASYVNRVKGLYQSLPQVPINPNHKPTDGEPIRERQARADSKPLAKQDCLKQSAPVHAQVTILGPTKR